jgi:hypothetical protein
MSAKEVDANKEGIAQVTGDWIGQLEMVHSATGKHRMLNRGNEKQMKMEILLNNKRTATM